jgi:hypothetical protein
VAEAATLAAAVDALLAAADTASDVLPTAIEALSAAVCAAFEALRYPRLSGMCNCGRTSTRGASLSRISLGGTTTRGFRLDLGVNSHDPRNLLDTIDEEIVIVS